MRSFRRTLEFAMSAMLGLVLSATGMAQDKTEAAPEKPATVQAPPAAAPGKDSAAGDKTPKIVGVRSGKTDSHTVGMDDQLFVKVTNLPELLKSRPISLYLDGRQIPVAEPNVHLFSDELEFRLVNLGTPESKKAWNDLLEPLSFTRPILVRVGPANGLPLAFEKQPASIQLIVVPQFWFWVWVVLFGAGLLVFVWLVKHTNILRDTGGAIEPGQLPKYSLARTQMAFWTILVLGGFVFLWLVLDETDAMTSSAVTLIGISGSTALGAVLVDSGKRSEVTAKLAPLQQEQQALQSDAAVAAVQPAPAKGTPPAIVPQPPNNPPATTPQPPVVQQVRTAELSRQIDALHQQAASRPTVHFLNDILSDSNGICLHRVQIFVWTLVLGVTYVRHVYEHLEMPEFSGTLLALMGVSSGTYIGFKFPEKQGPPT